MTSRRFDDAFVPRLAKKARLRFDRHEGRHMIVYPERGLVLNDTAAAIVQKCDGTRTVAALVDELAEAHPEAGRDAITRDVEGILGDLRDKGLLEVP